MIKSNLKNESRFTLTPFKNQYGKTLKTKAENMDLQNRKTMIFKVYLTDYQYNMISYLKMCNHFYTSFV